MPRIFKGSESTLRLLISKTGDYQALTGIKIKLYTTDIENAIEIIDGIQVCKNIAIITLAPRAFMGMEDGLINYIIDGATEDDVFHTERQSNYMLKSLSYINEDGVASQTMTIESNGEYRVTPNDGLYVDINVNVPDLNGSYDDGFNVGYGQGKTDGANEQKGKLESINITENGTYSKEDGYNHIEVNVPDLNGSYNEGYGQGKTDGVNEQKSKLESINITENGVYSKEDGYNHIEVNVPDLNGSYNEGYGQGKTDGVNEQKSKLETISITENGTYTKEDGYNHIEVNVPDLNGSYDEGYADAAAKARVLNVTKNGTYLSKFSDPIPIGTITGVYNDGTEFNNYAELNGKVFNTKIASSVNSRLEFWYKGDNTINGGGWNLIIGAGNSDDTRSFQVKYFAFNNNSLCMDGASRVIIDGWDDTIWHHLIVSETEGIWIDGEKKGDFPISTYIKGEFFINGIGYDTNGTNTANGTFGMIKIDDVVIIPTADGFLNTNTGELLEVVKDGGYTYTEGQVKYGEGELYKTINVNVPDLNGSYDEGKTDGVNEQKGKLTQIRITENGTYAKEDGYSEVVVDVPDLNGSYDEGYAQGKTDGVNEQKSKLETISITENGTYSKEDGYNQIEVNVPDLNGSYEQGKTDGVNEQKGKLESINITENGTYTKEDGYNHIEVNVNAVPKINVKKAGLKFGYSSFEKVPEWADFDGIINMASMFYYCIYLQTIPLIDTSNVMNMASMFYYCMDLQTIPPINTSNVTNMGRMFYNCKNLRTIPKLDARKLNNINECFRNGGNNVTDVGGWENLKCSWNDNYGLKNCPNLTYQSCINVLNGLYDFTGNGETPGSNQGQLKVHANFLTAVGDEISIGTNKGWTITA